MYKLSLIVVLFFTINSFKTISATTSKNTTYTVVSGHLEGAESDGCNKWVISNIAVYEPNCKVDKMMEFIFSDYYLEKYGDKCAIRGIYANHFSTYEEAVVYRQKLIDEKRKGDTSAG